MGTSGRTALLCLGLANCGDSDDAVTADGSFDLGGDRVADQDLGLPDGEPIDSPMDRPKADAPMMDGSIDGPIQDIGMDVPPMDMNDAPADRIADVGPDGGTFAGPGDVAPSSGSCGGGGVPRTTCSRVIVDCPSVPSIEAEIRVTQPAGPSRLGVIVFATGGYGDSWFEQYAQGRRILRELSDEGYLVIQRRWLSPWEEGPGGMLAVSCRYAALLAWAYNSYHTSGGFCATGGSGGSSEVSYALSHWGMGAILDYAVPTSGPPMARMDHGCLDTGDRAWLDTCADFFDRYGICAAGRQRCGYGTGDAIDLAYTPGTPCASMTASARGMLFSDSVDGTGASFHYGSTPVHFIFAATDCSNAIPMGLGYYEAITSTKSHEVLTDPSVEHSLHASTVGANAIADALRSGCH